MAGAYKSKYLVASGELRQKDAEISKLQKLLTEAQTKIQAQETEYNTKVTSLEEKIGITEEDNKGLEEKNSSLEEKNENISEQLRKKELSRFASAYADQEVEYKGQQDLWFRFSLWATGLLVSSVLLSIFGPSWIQKGWYEEPGFYLLNAIFLTLFVYTLKQHAHFGNLRIDYANRKTLAQSYQYIVANEEGEHSDIQNRFFERASDVFSSKAILRSSDVTMYEAIVSKLLGK